MPRVRGGRSGWKPVDMHDDDDDDHGQEIQSDEDEHVDDAVPPPPEPNLNTSRRVKAKKDRTKEKRSEAMRRE